MWTYDKQAVGRRIRVQRKAMNLTIEEIAERIDKSAKFCADVERGLTGVSIETLLSMCNVLKMSPNMILLGSMLSEDSDNSFEGILAQCTPAQRVRALEFLQLFVKPL